MIFIDDTVSGTFTMLFPVLSLTSGSEYQEVIVQNCSGHNWTVNVNASNLIYGNSVTGVTSYTSNKVGGGKGHNSSYWRSFKNGANYQWIVV